MFFKNKYQSQTKTRQKQNFRKRSEKKSYHKIVDCQNDKKSMKTPSKSLFCKNKYRSHIGCHSHKGQDQ